MNILFVKMEVRPEKRKELLQTLPSIVEQVRTKNGCLHSGFYQDVEDENDFLVVENWATQKDTDDHLRSDIFTVLIGAGSLMQRPPEIVIHTVSCSAEVDGWTPKFHCCERKDLNDESIIR